MHEVRPPYVSPVAAVSCIFNIDLQMGNDIDHNHWERQVELRVDIEVAKASLDIVRGGAQDFSIFPPFWESLDF